MALRHAVLAALLEGEASGYELAKRFDVSTANYWAATPQQLYRELDRLASAGLVSARLVEQQRRPNKRVFALTSAGREALHAFTTRPPRATAVRDELLVQVEALEAGDASAIAAAVAERMTQAEAKLALYDRMRERLLAGRSEEVFLREAQRIGPYLTLMRGRAFEEENIRWGRSVLDALAVRAF